VVSSSIAPGSGARGLCPGSGARGLCGRERCQRPMRAYAAPTRWPGCRPQRWPCTRSALRPERVRQIAAREQASGTTPAQREQASGTTPAQREQASGTTPGTTPGEQASGTTPGAPRLASKPQAPRLAAGPESHVCGGLATLPRWISRRHGARMRRLAQGRETTSLSSKPSTRRAGVTRVNHPGGISKWVNACNRFRPR
jgi:hypothetical protein